jgi:lycopene beta-cyclase
MQTDFDIVLAGGGLQSSMIALALFARKPALRVAIVEALETLGGNHTWCFHQSDVPEASRAWLSPLVVERWPRWEVRFPELRRTFDSEYAAISSSRLDQVLREAFAKQAGSAIFFGERATQIEENSVTLASGKTLRAALVVDARGPELGNSSGSINGRAICAWQKFVGLELELVGTANIGMPIIMDACVEQEDGFRFVYALPFAATPAQPTWGLPASPARILIEETYFSDGPELDVPRLTQRCLEWAGRLGLQVARTVRTESGVLPLPLAWSAPRQTRGPLLAGYRGGFFHPTTGYSLPVAVRVAEQIAGALPGPLFGAEWSSFVSQHSRRARFAVLLNRMLFIATPPDRRRDSLERFHRLGAETVARFYSLEPTRADQLRVLCGRPPRGISITRAIREAVTA